jgi:3-oxoacyl-[acyl-carrier protein] reductase
MDLQLKGRVVSVIGPVEGTLAACRQVLEGEGAVMAAAPTDHVYPLADIVIAIGGVRPGSDLLDISDPDDLYSAWDDMTDAVSAYRAALPRMLENKWGRFVWVGSAQAKSVDAQADELAAMTSLGILGLNKVITGEVGSNGITANAVLRGGVATDEDVANAVTFLCSEGAAYLSGITITVDGGVGSGIF